MRAVEGRQAKIQAVGKMVEIHGDQRPTILVLSIVFPLFSILAVAFRFEARRLKRVNLGADDWTILAALVSYLVAC